MASSPPLQKIVSRSRSSRMRNINAQTSTLSLGSNTVRNFNEELRSKAANNGSGFVWHRSDCSYPKVALYMFGGAAWLGCGYFVDSTTTQYMKAPDGYFNTTHADIVWYGDPYKARSTINKIKNKDTSVDYNWTIDDILDMITGNGVSDYFDRRPE